MDTRAIRIQEETAMRTPRSRETSKTIGTGELKAVAKEAWEVGAHALHAAGEWFDNMRTSTMKERNRDEHDQEWMRTRNGGYRQGSGEERQRDMGRGAAGQERADRDAGNRGGFEPEAMRGDYDYERRHAPWREQGLGSGDYPYDRQGTRAEARHGGYGMDEAERTYGRGQHRQDWSGQDWSRQDWSRDDGRNGRRDAYAGARGQFDDASGPSGDYREYGSGYGRGGYQTGRSSYGQQRDYLDHASGYAQGGHQETGSGYGRQGGYRDQGLGYGQGDYPSAGYQQYGAGQGGYRQSGYGGDDWQRGSQGRGFESRRGLGPSSYARTDERIREDVNESLMNDDYVDATHVTVQVKEGAVVLGGSVEDRREKHRAEDIADSCSGVRDVRNEISVASGSAAMRGGANERSSRSSSAPSSTASTSAAAKGRREGGS